MQAAHSPVFSLFRRFVVSVYGFPDVPLESRGALCIILPEFVLCLGVAAFRGLDQLRRIRGVLGIQERRCGACDEQQGKQERMFHGDLCQFVFCWFVDHCAVQADFALKRGEEESLSVVPAGVMG